MRQVSSDDIIITMSKKVETSKELIEKKLEVSRMSRSELEQQVMLLTTTLEESMMKLSWYEEQLRRATDEKFGPSSEKSVDAAQISFFNEAEAESTLAGVEPTLEEIQEEKEDRKKKPVGKKEKMTRDLPTVVLNYTLSEGEQDCPQCGEHLHEMKTIVRKELTVVPATVHVTERVQHVYTCRTCEAKEIKTPVVYAPMPAPVLTNSIASPSLVAQIMTRKYVEAVPLYRQEQQLQRYGFDISRQTMSNWVVRTSELWLKRLYGRMKEELLRQEVLHADETVLEVIREPGREATSTSYMWVYRTGNVGKDIVIYEYTPRRSGENAEKFLKGFLGFLHTDGYAGYHRLLGPVTLVGCWAHMRRKFSDALQGIAPNGIMSRSVATEGFNHCNGLFRLEKKWAKLTPEERLEKRKKEAEPLVSAYFAWIRELEPSILPKSLLGKAFTYAKNQESNLRNYLKDGRLELSNNRAERSIKPFVIGRKNWLFANTPAGATSSAIIYSIVETAKENGLNPFPYLEYLLESIPNLNQNGLTMEDMLPWSESLPDKCRSKNIKK